MMMVREVAQPAFKNAGAAASRIGQQIIFLTAKGMHVLLTTKGPSQNVYNIWYMVDMNRKTTFANPILPHSGRRWLSISIAIVFAITLLERAQRTQGISRPEICLLLLQYQ